MTDLADALFRPRAVALVGASGDAAKNTARPQRFLAKHGFAGPVIPINPGRAEVLGTKAYPDIASAPGPIDHAFVMVPAAAVLGVIADCAAASVRVATIYSDGFADAGPEGMERQHALVAQARAAGIRLIGPNSMGVIDTHAGAAITVNAALEAPELSRGGIAVVSQSGTVLGTLISRGQARGIGFSRLVSIGNEADLSVGEIVDLMIDDDATRTILLFLEMIRDPDALAAAARRAFDAGKPVVVYKLGRSAAGRALAVSHSGAIVGPDAAASAYFRAHGMVRVEMMETLLEIPPLLAQPGPGDGRRVAVLTTTGGGAAMVVDRLGALGIETVSAPDSLVRRLEPMGIHVGEAPVIDVTMAGARGEVYGAALAELMASDVCDAVVAVVGSSAQFHAHVAVEPIVSVARTASKPLAAFLVPQADESLALLAEAGIAGFRTPEACADAIRACLDWSPPVSQPEPSRDLSAVDLTADASRVFAALGIAQAEAVVIDGPAPVSPIGYPVAVKALVRGAAHKTELGAVALGVADDAGFGAACADVIARVRAALPEAAIDGLLVQRMESGLAEALLGYRDNPETGPIVVLGIGGVLAEIHRDVAVRLAPIDHAVARAMIEEVAGLATLRGFRGLPAGDCDALADAVAAVSDLARLPGRPIAEAEINPLIVKPAGAGVVAIDALVVMKDDEG